jgi:flavin-dependent dehydrogenase
MKDPLPIEIIGGGLAGLSLGYALQRSGLAVTLFEAGDYPRHRVCGEFITGLAASTIQRLALEDLLKDALHHREVAWFFGDGPSPIQRLPSPALGLSRFALDARLASAFVAAGGTLHCQTRCTDLGAKPGRVLAMGRRRARSPWLGLKIHAFSLPLARDLEVHLGEQAYVGLSRVEENRVNICGLFRRRPVKAKGSHLLLDYIRAAGLAALAERLSAAKLDDRSICAVAGVEFDQNVPAAAVSPAEARIGDACAMVPPFTGNGMAMAFQGAELALDPLLSYARGQKTWPDACRELHLALGRRFRVRLASARALHPYLLQPGRQRWLSRLTRAHVLPFRPLYSLLH